MAKNDGQLNFTVARNIQMIIATALLVIGAAVATFWFSWSYTGLNGAIQKERVDSMSQIGDIIMEKVQLLSDSYSSELERLAALLVHSDVTELEEANRVLGEAEDVYLLFDTDTKCKSLDGTEISVTDVQALIDGLTEEVTSFFGTIAGVGDFWIFEMAIDGVVLDGEPIAAILRMVESEEYSDITTNMIFDENGATYVVSRTGMIDMRPADGYFHAPNILSELEAQGVGESARSILREAFYNDTEAEVVFDIDGVTWLFMTVPEHNGRNILLTVPISITAKNTFDSMQQAIVSMVIVIMLLMLLFLLWMVYFSRRNAQMKLERAKANSKSDFMSKVSHDIRTPLNAIVGMLEIAERSIGKPQQVRESLHSAKKSSEYLIAIINDVLDMSRIENGKMDIASEPFDLNELLSAVMIMQSPPAKRKGVELVLSNETRDDVMYIGDSVRIKQCLVNLVSNAIKFTPEGGIVTLTCEGSVGDDGIASLTMSVQDTGIGMSKEFMKNLFVPFEQERSSATASGSVGSGLGLSIVHSLVELMGGTVTADSRPGEGSQFTIQLSLKSLPKTAASEEQPDSSVEILKGKRVLLAEDNDINRSIATFFLEDMGMAVDGAENGQIAVEKLEASERGYYDLILMDIQMPVMDGLEAARRVRESNHPDAKTVPIIALSANAFREDAERSREAGMQEHLPKPIDPKMLERALIKIFDNKERDNKNGKA